MSPLHLGIEHVDFSANNQIYIESLRAMKKSLESSYEFRAIVQDESDLLRGIGKRHTDYVEFAGYLRNEGMRRFRDIADTINQAVNEISRCDSTHASAIYLETLKIIMRQTRHANILEEYSHY